MKYLFLFLIVFSTQAEAKECAYPAEPINWILRFCGHAIQSDDEIAIQDSHCFKSAEKDLKNKDLCKVNEKYKTKLCQKLMEKEKKYKFLPDCLKDAGVKPFFAGE